MFSIRSVILDVQSKILIELQFNHNNEHEYEPETEPTSTKLKLNPFEINSNPVPKLKFGEFISVQF
jgi:hypothetical protein